MLPIYRLSEGAENLDRNYKTFDECTTVFKKNGIVLIFSEGGSVNEWGLRPLKKGTARLALQAWEQNIPLQIITAGINYQSFTSFGKNITLNFGRPVTKENLSFSTDDNYGAKVKKINTALKVQLEKQVAEIKPADQKIIRERFYVQIPIPKKILLFVPAVLGYLLHAPLYIPLKRFALKKFGKEDAFDSVLISMLFLLYPLYLVLISIAVGLLIGSLWWVGVFLLLPFTAWSYVQIKNQV